MQIDPKKLSRKDLESFMVAWNVRFKYDRLWRRKYNIPFMSDQHLQSNQIDIFLDLLEDKLVEKAQVSYLERQKNKEEYEKNGIFLKEIKISEEEEDRLFKKLRFK
jgi:hypothetical protein